MMLLPTTEWRATIVLILDKYHLLRILQYLSEIHYTKPTTQIYEASALFCGTYVYACHIQTAQRPSLLRVSRSLRFLALSSGL